MQKIMSHTSTASRLISDRQIAALSKQIVEKFSPEKIILFGSYAYGVPHDNSIEIEELAHFDFETAKTARNKKNSKNWQITKCD